MLGLDSPPFTPLDLPAARTPETPSADDDDTDTDTDNDDDDDDNDKRRLPRHVPDPTQLTRQLALARRDSLLIHGGSSSISINRSMSGMSGPKPAPAFDENAWETYLHAFQVELADVRTRAWPRFKGRGRAVERRRIERRLDGHHHHHHHHHHRHHGFHRWDTAEASEEEEGAEGEGGEEEAEEVWHAFDAWWAASARRMRACEAAVHDWEEPRLELIRIERVAKGMSV